MASDTVHNNVAETMWIDPDIGFEADAVERLRAHGLPLACGVFPQTAGRSLACHLLPDMDKLVFGKQGGLVEIQYAAAGFLHVRREVYETIRDRLPLPLCNTRFGRGLWPFFLPLAVEEMSQESGVGSQRSAIDVSPLTTHRSPPPRHRYLTEDFAFSHRARQAGFKVMADTSIRLWRIGSYPYGWEDAGSEAERFETYHFQVE